MPAIRVALVALALCLALGATPALAEKPVLRLSGASPTLVFDPTGPTTADYVYTNSGEGTLRGERVTWSYEERGSVDFTDLSQVVDSASYTVVRYQGKKAKAKPIVLDVVVSSYRAAYTGEGTPPCTTGTFGARLKQGATVQGTFDCAGGVPSGSMEFTIERGSKAEADLSS